MFVTDDGATLTIKLELRSSNGETGEGGRRHENGSGGEDGCSAIKVSSLMKEYKGKSRITRSLLVNVLSSEG